MNVTSNTSIYIEKFLAAIFGNLSTMACRIKYFGRTTESASNTKLENVGKEDSKQNSKRMKYLKYCTQNLLDPSMIAQSAKILKVANSFQYITAKKAFLCFYANSTTKFDYKYIYVKS